MLLTYKKSLSFSFCGGLCSLCTLPLYCYGMIRSLKFLFVLRGRYLKGYRWQGPILIVDMTSRPQYCLCCLVPCWVQWIRVWKVPLGGLTKQTAFSSGYGDCMFGSHTIISINDNIYFKWMVRCNSNMRLSFESLKCLYKVGNVKKVKSRVAFLQSGHKLTDLRQILVRIFVKIAFWPLTLPPGQRSWHQMKAHIWFPIRV